MARVCGHADGVGADEMIDLVVGFLVGAAVTALAFAMYGNPRAEQLEERMIFLVQELDWIEQRSDKEKA